MTAVASIGLQRTRHGRLPRTFQVGYVSGAVSSAISCCVRLVAALQANFSMS